MIIHNNQWKKRHSLPFSQARLNHGTDNCVKHKKTWKSNINHKICSTYVINSKKYNSHSLIQIIKFISFWKILNFVN